MVEKVILVDESDNALGLMEKMEAHEKGLLHRAFSVFILDDNGDLLLQQRAKSKYHSGGLWTNTCCSHPRDEEKTIDAAHRRLMEEMGFDCEIEKMFDFVYKAELDQGLTEHELDHLFVGYYNGEPIINPEEVEDWKKMSLNEVEEDIKNQPQYYTEWFKIIFDRFLREVRSRA
tara:strand:+ start:61086 stop:61607 length:522 start_codon:yes stop_codon:yes gene_type:complete